MSIAEALRENFAYWRARSCNALEALAVARIDLAQGKRRYGHRSIHYNPGTKTRWIENVSDGLRVVGFADEVMRREGSCAIDHQGWYITPDYDEVYRGLVLLLPHGRYLAGYADPHNEDCARVEFEILEDAKEAARRADRMAEIEAEKERDYQTAWRAGRTWEELGEELKGLRAERGRLRKAMKGTKGEVRRACLNVVESKGARVAEIVEERAELLRNFGNSEGWKE